MTCVVGGWFRIWNWKGGRKVWRVGIKSGFWGEWTSGGVWGLRWRNERVHSGEVKFPWELQGLKGKEWGTGNGWVAGLKSGSKNGLIDRGMKEKLNIRTHKPSPSQNNPLYKKARISVSHKPKKYLSGENRNCLQRHGGIFHHHNTTASHSQTHPESVITCVHTTGVSPPSPACLWIPECNISFVQGKIHIWPPKNL